MDLLSELRTRGLIYQLTDEALGELLQNETVTLYAGFDPSAASLHVGNLLHLVTLARFQQAGHYPIAVVGGATGMIGDPSGKSAERNLLMPDEIEANLNRQTEQIERILDTETDANPARILNNADWLGKFSFLEFLRDVGKHFSVPNMLAKDSVKSRLATGISFTEFAYALLQAYDFLHLFEQFGCKLQIGGQDQWGNIIAGVDLVRRRTGKTVYGLTSELITTASGAKFGKSEGNAIWLDAKLTSPYHFYQFWMRTDDADVIPYLKMFTFIELDEIDALARDVQSAPQKRTAQKRLAEHMTEMVHGKDAARMAIRASEVLYGSEIKYLNLTDELIQDVFAEVPSSAFATDMLSAGIGIVDALTESGAVPSKSEARRLIGSGGVYVNNVRSADVNYELTTDDLASEHFIVLRTGKKNYHLLRFE